MSILLDLSSHSNSGWDSSNSLKHLKSCWGGKLFLYQKSNQTKNSYRSLVTLAIQELLWAYLKWCYKILTIDMENVPCTLVDKRKLWNRLVFGGSQWMFKSTYIQGQSYSPPHFIAKEIDKGHTEVLIWVFCKNPTFSSLFSSVSVYWKISKTFCNQGPIALFRIKKTSETGRPVWELRFFVSIAYKVG